MRSNQPDHPNTTNIAHRQVYGQSISTNSADSSQRSTPSFISEDGEPTSQVPVFAKPFDQWSPQGGGAESDIFRRFKILASEEEDFLTHWARLRLSSGIFSRDENGILVFRVNPAELANLNELSIMSSDSKKPQAEYQWSHVYDEEGVSWLTRFRGIELRGTFERIKGTNGQIIKGFGKVGQCGPSGFTPENTSTQRAVLPTRNQTN